MCQHLVYEKTLRAQGCCHQGAHATCGVLSPRELILRVEFLHVSFVGAFGFTVPDSCDTMIRMSVSCRQCALAQLSARTRYYPIIARRRSVYGDQALAWQCRAQVPKSNGNSERRIAPVSRADDSPDAAEQEEIARAASVVLGGAEMVLREKLEEYDAELKEVESFDDNIIYRCETAIVGSMLLFTKLERFTLCSCGCRGVNSFTLRLLKRKRAFIEKRILTIQELSRDVQSCSLDSKCTFLLKSSSELEDLTEQVNQTLDEVFARGAVETEGNSVVRPLLASATTLLLLLLQALLTFNFLHCLAAFLLCQATDYHSHAACICNVCHEAQVWTHQSPCDDRYRMMHTCIYICIHT